MHALVTGCAGFIGSHLSERLLGDGWTVTGVDAFRPYYPRAEKERNLAGLSAEPGFDLVEADLCEADLAPLMARADAVFHLAAQAGVRKSFDDFAGYTRDNVVATQRVFAASLDAGVERVVWASSSSVYGDADAYPCDEESTPTSPRSPYGATKRSCEDLAAIYRGLGLSAVGLRYFTVYGPRQRPDMAMRLLCEAAYGGPRFRLFGDGAQSRDFTYVADAVDATVRAARGDDPAAIYNVGGGEEATMSRVIDLVGELSGREVPVERVGVQRGDVRRTCADTTRARRGLDWRPETALREGLAAQVTWVRGLREAGLASVG
jgi:nucleoside-diphosphate-sugar epimerase